MTNLAHHLKTSDPRWRFCSRLIVRGLVALVTTSALLLASETSSASLDIPRVFLGKWGSLCNLLVEVEPVGPGTCIDPDGPGPLEAGDGQLAGPLGVTVNPDGIVYVADTFNHRIQGFSSDGSFLGKWGKAGGAPGAGDGEFSRPRDLATDAAGNVYVADSDNHRIQKFTASGVFLGWAGKCTGPMGGDCDVANQRSFGFTCSDATCTGLATGTLAGQYSFPHGVDVDEAGNVLVSDTVNDRIQVLDSSGAFVAEFGSSGSLPGQLDDPLGIVADGSGSIYVVDQGNDRIQVFDNSLTYVDDWGEPGSGKGQFVGKMWGVATDANGNVFVTDGAGVSPPARVQVFTSSGMFLFQWGTDGNSDGQFSNPHGIAIGPGGNIFVADSANDRIQVFGPGPAAVGGIAKVPDVAGTPLETPQASGLSAGLAAVVAATGALAFGGAAWYARRRLKRGR